MEWLFRINHADGYTDNVNFMKPKQECKFSSFPVLKLRYNEIYYFSLLYALYQSIKLGIPSDNSISGL